MNPVTPETLLHLQFVSSPSFSEDGRLAAFVVAHADINENSYKHDLYLLRVSDGSVARLTAGGDAAGFVWTKQGTILFAASRQKDDQPDKDTPEKTSYYEISPAGGEAVRAFTLPIAANRLIPVDEDLYVVQALQNNGQPKKDRAYEIIEESPFWFNGRGFTEALRGRIYLYRRSTEELTPITDPWFNASLCDVKDGQILYTGALWEKGRRYQYPGLYLYSIADKTSNQLLEKDTYSFYGAEFWGDGRVMINAKDPDELAGMSTGSLYVIDTKTLAVTNIHHMERGLGGSVGSDARLGGGHQTKVVGDTYYFVTTINESAYLRTIKLDGSGLSEPLTPDGSVDSFDISKDGHVLVCAMYGDKLAELYLDGRQVTFFNEGLLKETALSTPIYHEFTDSDGVCIHGYCMKPVGYQEGKKYPCILHVHGGPLTVFGSVFHLEMQQWASAGFFVIFCNPRGGDGRGDEFADLCNKYGTVDYRDLMEFTDEMLKVYPDIDKDRLGITGGSYGGFMTNWVIGHTNRFKCACSQRSISNWIVFEHTSDIGPSFTRNHQGTTTRENVHQLWDHSPLKYADKCTTPTLFICSDRDFRCWMADGLAMFTALKMHDCPARLVLFHDETHELSRSGKPRNRIKRMSEITSWMKQYLIKEHQG